LLLSPLLLLLSPLLLLLPLGAAELKPAACELPGVACTKTHAKRPQAPRTVTASAIHTASYFCCHAEKGQVGRRLLADLLYRLRHAECIKRPASSVFMCMHSVTVRAQLLKHVPRTFRWHPAQHERQVCSAQHERTLLNQHAHALPCTRNACGSNCAGTAVWMPRSCLLVHL
jgi:hypothetical protein